MYKKWIGQFSLWELPWLAWMSLVWKNNLINGQNNPPLLNDSSDGTSCVSIVLPCVGNATLGSLLIACNDWWGPLHVITFLSLLPGLHPAAAPQVGSHGPWRPVRGGRPWRKKCSRARGLRLVANMCIAGISINNFWPQSDSVCLHSDTLTTSRTK